MLLYMLLNAREASFLQPMQASRKLKFPVAIQMFALYAVASFVGWALVGVRVVLLKSMLFWGARL